MKYILLLITCIYARNYIGTNTLYCINNEGTSTTFDMDKLNAYYHPNATRSFTCPSCRYCNDQLCIGTYDNASSILYDCICEEDHCGYNCGQRWRNKLDYLSCISGVICGGSAAGYDRIVAFFAWTVVLGVFLVCVSIWALSMILCLARKSKRNEEYDEFVDSNDSVKLEQQLQPEQSEHFESIHVPQEVTNRNERDNIGVNMCISLICLFVVALIFVAFLAPYLVYRSKWIDEITAMKGNGTHICI